MLVLPIPHSSKKWKELESNLIQDITTLSAYLQIWRPKLQTGQNTHVLSLKRLARTKRDASANTLRTDDLSLFYSTAEYCALVWCRSAHTRFICSVLNYDLLIFTGCLHLTPTEYLPVLSGTGVRQGHCSIAILR